MMKTINSLPNTSPTRLIPLSQPEVPDDLLLLMPGDGNDATDSSREAARWTWITATDTESRRRAKAHTSREVKRRKAVLTQKNREKKSGIRKPLLPATIRSRQSLEIAQLAKRTLVPDPTSPLGAGRVDPFAQYPAALEKNELRELVDHCES
jgi:hypothetical protein